MPYKYVVGNVEGAYGFNQPTNIIKKGDFYYAMINDWGYRAQKYGPCLIRSKDPFDPTSWRAWNGIAFVVQFVNAYVDKNFAPEQHVCNPVMPGSVDGIVLLEEEGIFLATQFTPDSRYGPPGLYIFGSTDLVHWANPTLVAKTTELEAQDGAGRWTYGYTSILDASSKDRNFSTISPHAYLYYVRLDGNHAPYGRRLVRRHLLVQVKQQ
jgi:hypothetical protein